MLTCPHCDQPLTRDGQVYRCPQGHTFDIAREGYVHLLRRPTRLQADTKEMLAARQRFLARGYYHPLAELVGATVGDWLRTRAAVTNNTGGGILDAGCGEGYYTRELARTLAATQATDGVVASARRPIFGVDLARDAVRLAARRAQQATDGDATGERYITWLVANIKEQLPFAPASMAVVINLFAPHNAQAFRDVLAVDGLLLAVIPAPTHLSEAREPLRLLSMQPEKRSHLLASLHNDFTLVDERSLRYDMTLDAIAQTELRTMTPQKRSHAGAASTTAAQGEATAAAADAPALLVTRAAFDVLAFTPRAR